MRYKNLLLMLLALIVSGVVAAIYFSGQKPDTADHPDTEQTQAEDEMNMIGKGVSMMVTEGQVKKWKIESDEAIYYPDDTGAELKNVRGEFYDAQGKPVLTFESPTGKMTQKNEVTLTGGATVATIDDQQSSSLNAQTMNWNTRSTEVLATGNVVLKHPSGTSRAGRCRFTLDFTKVSLEGGVVSEVGI
ncbi:MAG: LPS export ABC transporter periplasmic protein LptC [Candidatus Melainabacteria bacterium]